MYLDHTLFLEMEEVCSRAYVRVSLMRNCSIMSVFVYDGVLYIIVG